MSIKDLGEEQKELKMKDKAESFYQCFLLTNDYLQSVKLLLAVFLFGNVFGIDLVVTTMENSPTSSVIRNVLARFYSL